MLHIIIISFQLSAFVLSEPAHLILAPAVHVLSSFVLFVVTLFGLMSRRVGSTPNSSATLKQMTNPRLPCLFLK